MDFIDLDECDLPPQIWGWLIAKKHEDAIALFLRNETLKWLSQKGAEPSDALDKVIDDYTMVAARYLITSNDIAEAIGMGLLAFQLTPFEKLVEADEELIVKITTALCGWFNAETGQSISANISYT